jgi:6-phosphogluconate dehydrogenase
MEMGMVGLGRMGGNMVQRLMRRGHHLIAYDRSPEAVAASAAAGATGAGSLDEFLAAFQQRPRVMWVMVPSGPPTSETVAALAAAGERGDIIIDGGNSNWRVALEDAATVEAHGLRYLDAGTSGGVWGLENGYCLMVGGPEDAYEHCLPLLRDLAPDGGGLVHTGPVGSGHFVKMIHNGIEYGMMAAYAEGFEIMKSSQTFGGLDLHAIAETWRNGSVIRSWLLDLIAAGLADDPQLSTVRGYVEDTGEGRWTVDTAVEEGVSAPVITMALFERFRSRMDDSFRDKMLAMMRKQFGGHAVRSEEPAAT